jgi:putative spermidine/putrescine transport system permease protein
VLLVGPLGLLVHQSFAAGGNSLTLSHYRALLSESFAFSLIETFKISIIATLAATLLGYLVAFYLIRRCSPRMRNVWLNIIVSILFLSLLIRIYALLLTFGTGPFMQFVTGLFNTSPTSRTMTEMLVVLGLLNFTIPLVILSLLGPIENIDPKLTEAAQSLGAAYWKAFFTIDLKLSLASIVLAGITTFSLCISAFLIPMVLGRGFVNFVANLVYVRFQEVFDPGTGAAMAVALLLITLLVIYGVQRVATSRG